jgi:hypothetical protein
LFTVCGPNSSHCNLPFLFSKKNNLPAIFGVTLRWRVIYLFLFFFSWLNLFFIKIYLFLFYYVIMLKKILF